MKLKVLKGKINSINQSTHTSGTITRQGGIIKSSNVWTFRIDNTPVAFGSRENISFTDGDEILTVGAEKRGTFHILCVKNLTTGAYYEPQTTFYYVLGSIIIICGFFTLWVFIGLLFVLWGELMILAGAQHSKGINLFRTVLKGDTNDKKIDLVVANQSSSNFVPYLVATLFFIFCIYRMLSIWFPGHSSHKSGWL